MQPKQDHLNVELGERRYPIVIEEGSLGRIDLSPWVTGEQVLIVSNETVAPLYLEQARASFPGCRVDEVILPDGERYKTWETLNRIFDVLIDKQHTRRTTLVALGGGVIGDITGFAAATCNGVWTSSRSRPRCSPRWMLPLVARPASTIPRARI